MLLRSGVFFVESAVRDVHDYEGLLVATRQIPSQQGSKNEYIVYGADSQDTLLEMSNLFELIERFASADVTKSWDEHARYQHFLKRVISGKITSAEICSFVKNRALKGYVYSGIMLLSGSNYQEVFEQIHEVSRHMRSNKSVALPPRLLFNQATDEAVVLIEYLSDVHQSNINCWLNAFISEIEDEMIERGNGYLAMSSMRPSLEDITVCLKDASEARDVGQILWPHHSKFMFTDLSPYILVRNADLSHVDFSDVELLHGSDALSFDGAEVLEVYMDCRNYKLAAKRLFVHENTLRYRIQKISELLNQNLDDPYVSHNIRMKIKLWKLYNANM